MPGRGFLRRLRRRKNPQKGFLLVPSLTEVMHGCQAVVMAHDLYLPRWIGEHTVMPCPFCRIIAGQAPAEIVHQDELVTAFRDAHPQAPTHILIVPNEHLPSVAHLEPAHAALWMRMVAVANDLARQEGLAESGYRLVTNCGPQAGQSVAHLHLHLLGGRWMRWPPG